MERGVISRPFGRLKDGRMSSLYTLSNSSGANVTLTDFGAALVGANMPDKHGTLGPVALGFDTIEAYENNPAYLGVIIGPVANRIRGGSFDLNGQTYHLDKNEGGNCLHSGRNGWHAKLWDMKPTDEGLQFSFKTTADEGGFPGSIDAAINIILSENNDLIYRLQARTDSPTPIAMTAHPYFNLTDGGASRIDDHIITIPSPSIAQLDAQGVATGDLLSVNEAGLGLRSPHPLSDFLREDGKLPFDFHYIVAGHGLRHMARVESLASGRRLDVHGSADGVQFYTGQHIPEVQGRGKTYYGPSHGFALEPQARPNAVNIPFFPSIILNPDEKYDDTIIYEFSLID